MAPNPPPSKGGRKWSTGGQGSTIGNYRVPMKNSTAAEEERKRQRLRDSHNLASGIEVALKHLLPNDREVVGRAVWNTHDSLAVDIELGIDSSRTNLPRARIVDRATPKGQAINNAGAYHTRFHNNGTSLSGVPLAPRAMTRYWSVLDQGKVPEHRDQQDFRGLSGPIGVPVTVSNNNELEPFSNPSSRSAYPYLQDPSDPSRLIGVPRPPLPAWATRPNYGKKGSRTSHPYLQDPSDPDKFVGVPRPFDWKDQNTKSDKYTGPAFHDNRRRQIETGVFPSDYPDHWISGQTFGDDDKDLYSAKRLYEKEQKEIANAGVALLNSADRDGDVAMNQEPEAFRPVPPSVSPAPASSACGSLIRVFDGFRIEDEVILETVESIQASRDFFRAFESDETPAGPVRTPEEVEASLRARIANLQPYRTSSVGRSTYAPPVSSGASGFDRSRHTSRLGTGSQRPFGGDRTSNYSTASKAPSTLFSYAGSSISRNYPFDSRFDALMAKAISIPHLEPTPAPKSSVFAGHASNLRAPMSHNEKVSQWAASLIPNESPNGRPASPSKFGSASRAPVEFIFPRKGLSGANNVITTGKANNPLSNGPLEMAGGGNGDTQAPTSSRGP